MITAELVHILNLVLISNTGMTVPSSIGPMLAAFTQGERPKSSSEWLVVAEDRQQAGNHEGAGRAFRRAFGALSERNQRIDIGARTALLCADAYWDAFEREPAAAHLQHGLDVLELWVTLAGPDSQSSMLPKVRETIAHLRALQGPLTTSDHALSGGNLALALGELDHGLQALADRGSAWTTCARLALGTVGKVVSVHEATAASERNEADLDAARDALRRCQQRQSPGDEATEEGSALTSMLADIEDLRPKTALPPPEEPEEPSPTPRRLLSPPPPPDPLPPRWVPPALLSLGVLATGAGATLIGEASAFQRVADREVERLSVAARGESDGVYEQNVDLIRSYADEASRRNRGLFVGGSVLAAGGVAMLVIGSVQLRKRRRTMASSTEEHVRLSPSVSRGQLSLSVVGRF